MSFIMKEAALGDIPDLCRLMGILTGREPSPGEMENRLEFVRHSPFDWLYVCKENGNTPGVLGFRIRENLEEVSRFGEISVIAVDPSFRRRGAGRFMMDFAEGLAAEKGCIGTWLVSGFGREEEAHHFYKDLGYRVNGYRFVKK